MKLRHVIKKTFMQSFLTLKSRIIRLMSKPLNKYFLKDVQILISENKLIKLQKSPSKGNNNLAYSEYMTN